MSTNQTYFFLLGNTPQLSLAEIQSVIDPQAKLVIPQLAKAQTIRSPQELIEHLGGTIKLLQPIDQLNPNATQATIKNQLVTHLTQLANQGKLDFYVAQIGQAQRPRLELKQLKESLKTAGIPSRFPPGKRIGLSAAKLLHQKIIELNLIYTTEAIYLAQTVAVQDIDRWSQRDRQRPYSQRKAGMLPLKLARMMVNLSIGQDQLNHQRLLDPFVGAGSVLIEAAMVKVPVLIGSDNQLKAVNGTKTNLNWLKSSFQLNFEFETYHQDATKLKLVTGKVDYLVTEPFLGRQTPNKNKIESIYLGLEKLYLGAFKNWRRLLKPQASVVIIFPSWPGFDQLNFQPLIDKLASLGYTTKSEPISYGRQQAQVVRKIWQFKFKG